MKEAAPLGIERSITNHPILSIFQPMHCQQRRHVLRRELADPDFFFAATSCGLSDSNELRLDLTFFGTECFAALDLARKEFSEICVIAC